MTLLQDFSKDQLTAFLTEKLNIKSFVAGQIFDWLNKGVEFDDMTNVAKDLRKTLQEQFVAQSVKIAETFVSKIDQTRKFLFKLSDGNIVEGVLMSYKHGNTLCVSTQVGCCMGCRFCASTLGGLVRNLSAGEILGQVVAVNALGSKEQRLVSNIVLMGSGEPLDNFANVVNFLNLVTSPDGLNISARNISLSTCGLVPEIKQLAEIDLPINLVISLHSADNQKRKDLMPIANKYSIEQLIEAARHYFEKTKRRVYFEYTLVDGQNDSYSDALKLASLLRGLPAHVNLIRLNTVKESKLKATTEQNAQKFLQYLTKLRISATLRRQLGSDIEGACGQLRRKLVGTKPD